MVAAATIGAAVVGAGVSANSARQEGKRADRRAASELAFAQERYDDWQAIYGPIQENLASYYNNLTPEFIEAQGLEAYEKEKDSAMKEIEANFAQRGIATSGIAAEVEKDIALQSAENRAKIRAEAPMKAAQEKSRFLQIGLGQNPANSMQQVLSNQSNQAANRSLMANQAAGEATQNAVETIFDVWGEED